MNFDVPDLYAALDALLQQIPVGEVTTYGTLAAALGDRHAARWIGDELRYEEGATQPSHRVLRADGTLGAGDSEAKAAKLREEGIEVVENASGELQVDLHRYAATIEGDQPLAALAAQQRDWQQRVELEDRFADEGTVAAVDVAYSNIDGAPHATAAYVLFERDNSEPLWQTTVTIPCRFPYITGFLSYREIPAHLAVLEKAQAAGKLATLLLVDGSGILHPRRMGVATMLGIAADVATIGVTKKHLVGDFDKEALKPAIRTPIVLQDELLGWATLPRSGSQRPLFISPGHRVGVETAWNVVRDYWSERRLPDPIHCADRLSKK